MLFYPTIVQLSLLLFLYYFLKLKNLELKLLLKGLSISQAYLRTS